MTLFCLDVSTVEQNPSINKLVTRLPNRYNRGMNKYRSPQDQRNLLLSDLLLKWAMQQESKLGVDLELSDLPQEGFDLCQFNQWIVCATYEESDFGIDLHRLHQPFSSYKTQRVGLRSEFAQHLQALRRATLRALDINHLGRQRLEINNDLIRLGDDLLHYQQIGIDRQYCCCIVSKEKINDITIVNVKPKTLLANAFAMSY